MVTTIGKFALVATLAFSCAAHGQEPESAQAPLPSFAELEAVGAIIGEIVILNRNIFDPENPKEDKLLFRWANALHVQTRVGVIQRALLFKTGEKLLVNRIDETERVLRGSGYLYDVHIRPIAYTDGIVDIEVKTRDTWTLDPGFSLSRSGGSNSTRIKLVEKNLLGTGATVSYGRSQNVDRSSNEFQFSNDRAFGDWNAFSFSHASNSDGRRNAGTIARPFYSLDTPWAAGLTASRDDRIDAVYNAGNVASEYRHRQTQAEVFGGLSKGRVDGWVQRYSIGITQQEDIYAVVPGRMAPSSLPADDRQVAPFFRFELIEDRFVKQQNRNLIDRAEFFALGFSSSVQLGWASTGFGSTRDALLYTGSVSRGFEPLPKHTLLASAAIAGQYADSAVRRQRFGGQAQYYLPQTQRWLFYASASSDMITRPEAADFLQLGGDNGLRGYPLRYQTGTRRVLVTLEERVYTDLYLLQIFRVGGAVFFDSGRAWGGVNQNTIDPGWLYNIGLGLRFFNTRTAFGHAWHVDIAAPLNADADVKKLQFLVKTKASF